ncbi:hypothetical protein [Coleofasciculus sp. FACHB-SPT9]|uniref:hypothetical protein n=1 Tax=Cyanophyceae TaxID=3028117 RepID=UPI001683DD26|nr:hypothetical protein [Coleofasciculus sp. FACHB-SPT9]MBD1890620.1 hypothetical protein [Coleofasciculus sp. FACHB-SPT9]
MPALLSPSSSTIRAPEFVINSRLAIDARTSFPLVSTVLPIQQGIGNQDSDRCLNPVGCMATL